jgi:Arc/MetJ-type ribon-helix-helix transcriptional regulator
MALRVSPQLEAKVEEIRISESYDSAEEVLADAVAALEEQIHERETAERVKLGFAQIERGEWIEFDPADGEARLKRARERASRGERPARHVCP